MNRQTYPARRMFVILVGVMALLVAIWLQVVRWQVLYAEGRRPSSRSKEFHMGTIVDAQGNVLAFDSPLYTLTVDRRLLHAAQKEEARAWMLSQGLPAQKVAKALDGNAPFTEFRHLPARTADAARQEIRRLARAGIEPWLRVDIEWVRTFPQGPVCAHVLGFRNWAHPPRAVGGVHEFYERFLLSGKELQPEHTYEATPPGGISPFFPSPYEHDLVLTLRLGVQYWAERELADAVERYQAKSGSVIIMDPRDGSILALANWPTFDPNHFYEYPSTANVWSNRAVSLSYEPGSVIKAVTFAAALDARVVTTDTVIYDPGVWTYGGVTIRNSQRRGFGNVTPPQILAKSLNVPTAKVATMLGPTRFYRYMDLFGFGRLTEIDQSNENEGTLRHPRERTWSLSDLVTNSFGQAMAATPIQIIRAMAALANGGYMVTPHVLKGYLKDGVYREVVWPRRERVIREETARVITSWLTGVVDAISIPDRVRGYQVAGKTGTAQVALPGAKKYARDEQNVTFVGYLPAQNPQVIILVFLERPERGPLPFSPKYIWGFNTAYPTFVRIADRVIPLLDIVPPGPASETARPPATGG